MTFVLGPLFSLLLSFCPPSYFVLSSSCYSFHRLRSDHLGPAFESVTPPHLLRDKTLPLILSGCPGHCGGPFHQTRGCSGDLIRCCIKALAVMANTAQCFYCFESLLASFEDRQPPSLADIETLWEQHEQSKKLSSLGDQNLDEEQEDAEAEIAQSVNDLDADAEGTRSSNRPHGLKLPSINRLQSQVLSDSSSTATTPSCASNTSSNSLLSSSTTVTTPSAQSEGISSRAKSTGQRYPLFVTWNTVSRGHKSLRGCIGTFEAQDLEAGLKSYALTSAFDDTRFSPIPKSLLPSLSCSLTLLGTFEPCTNAMDWTLGTHGIRISFIHRGRRYGATYLPDVAVEQGWSKEETVESLMRKAGWDGGAGGVARRLLRAGASSSGTKPWDQVSDFRTVRYQGLKASASYEEWQEWRTWVLSLDDGREILDTA